ncbi:hypothetical protein AVMA1855_19995 [Acidovorax sp. SUPP1855]|uniref:hypothetical protein n=1 Tax=Acidovorax sp. SUPP1855 TaxID=431774 RepID=UPI0023DE56F6|nr:hypothetical protein [Acidovorax sp. SUPP1855]GKS86473.1 hypothetical protein AVMA1855_19995 [Acidovorax sp. SUPP1855]
MPSAAAPIAGAVVGGLMSDDGGGQQQTNTKEPWAPAAPLLRNSLTTGDKLQNYYQQNPFNQQQQVGYQNLYSDLDSFRDQTAPGLMNFANRLMSTNYQRAPAGSEAPQYSYGGNGTFQMGGQQQAQPMGGMQSTKPMQYQGDQGGMQAQGSMGGSPDFAGLIASMQAAQGQPQGQGMAGGSAMGGAMGGLLGGAGPFAAPGGQSYGLIDFAAQNPFNGALKPTPAAEAPSQQTVDDLVAAALRKREQDALNEYHNQRGS